MNCSGCLPIPQQFMLYGFAVAVPIITGKEDKNAIRQGVFNFILMGNNIVFSQPMSIIPVNPIEGNEFLKAKKSPVIKGDINELPYKTGFYYFAIKVGGKPLPLTIRCQESFRVEINYPSGPVQLPSARDCRITVFMVGIWGQAR
ncbi:MAG: hypothetical protein V1701_02555 [Planctomycetota bacterium]